MTELRKMSKKAQHEFYNSRRGSWNGVNPVTKVVKNKKKQNRVKHKNALYYDYC